MVQDKSRYLSESKQIVDDIASLEADIGHAIRKVNKDVDLFLQKEKKGFRDGCDDRLQKVSDCSN